MRLHRITTQALCFLLVSGPVSGIAAAQQDALKEGFVNPPQSARPRVWWHWMNGNITQEGIKLDLEWMKRIGLGGFQNFDASLGTPQVVEHRLSYMTPAWNDAFRYATRMADSLGLEEAIAGSPGWSETGGPWVPPSEGMKKYVWSETLVRGGKRFTGVLAHPPSNTGEFQGLPVHDLLPPPAGAAPLPSFYADSAVIAYRVLNATQNSEAKVPRSTASSGSPDLSHLADGLLATTTKLPMAAIGNSSWIQYEYAHPTTIYAATLALIDADPLSAAMGGAGQDKKELQASDDGKAFRTVVVLPNNGSTEHTVSFPAVTARFFRVSFTRVAPPPMPGGMGDIDFSSFGMTINKPQTDYVIAQLALHTEPRVNRFEEKAGFAAAPDLYSLATPDVTQSETIRAADVLDLTAKMQPDGSLEWTPPPGDWIVLRFGYSLLGITNHPATAEATGIEVDKLNRSYVKNYMDHYLDRYQNVVGAEMMGQRGVKYVITDSWEAGTQNWTDNMIVEFKRRRGYDLRPWMPVLAGRVVGSAEASDAFLWDFRKTIADLTAEEHYGQVEASLKERGMGHYGESHESGRAFIADGMEVKKLDDIPMGAMWTQAPGVNNDLFGYDADDRESASVAHLYGQNIAAAESMTAIVAPWGWSPATLKPTADKELANGINRFVIHCSVHQPLIDKTPGLGLGPFGQWFTRNETWAEDAGSWISYLSRSSYLLQQGHFNADILYFYGEDSNLTALFADKAPPIPEGYGFDYVNADAIEHKLSVQDGHISSGTGTEYRVLALDPYTKHMSLPVLKAIKRLVETGAVLVGTRPLGSPSEADDPKEYAAIVDELWGDGNGVRSVGLGHVYAGKSIEKALAGLAPDFEYSRPQADTRLLFVHRKMADSDIYFVDNRTDQSQNLNATFRIAGFEPELWHAETGLSEPASYEENAGRTTVPLKLEPWGTVFVVFRKSSSIPVRVLPALVERKLAEIEGRWSIDFQAGRGAPASISVDKLTSWSDSTDPGIKYFSGNGTYSKELTAAPDWFENGTRLWLDLGKVSNLATVTVNGKNLGTVWHAPYRIDVTEALKPGQNEIQVRVTNAWVNRMIGDQQPGVTEKVTFTVIHPYKASSQLQSSGLLGPVEVVGIRPEVNDK